MKSCAGSVAVLVFSLATAVHAESPPPVAQRGDTVETVFGQQIHDPYRWMEGNDNTAFTDWLKAQGVAGRAWLDTSPALEGWRTTLSAAGAGTLTNRAQHRAAGRIFFLRLEQGKQGVLMMRPEAGGEEKVLLDPNALEAAGGHASITGYSVSPDGRTVAVNVDHGGNEITSIEFYDADSGAKLPDQLDNIWGEFQADWTTDGKAVAYTQMAPAAEGVDGMLNMRARYHVMGTPGADDKTLAVAGGNPSFPLAPQEFPIVSVGASSDWAMAYAVGARAEARVCLVRKADLLKPDAKFNCLVGYDDGIQGAAVYGNNLYLLSKKTTPNGEMLKLDLTRSQGLAGARVVLRESPEEVLTGFNIARDGVYVRVMKAGLDHFVRLSHGNTPSRAVQPPFPGAMFLTDSDPAADGLIFTIQDWSTPRQLFAYAPSTGTQADLHLGASSPKDYRGAIDIVTVEVPSTDGAKVPLTLLVPKGTKPDGKALTLLDAYGAYGQSTQPFFDPMTLEWVMKGHIYGFVAIRGGGEKGDAWRLAGKGPNKHHGIEDLMAAADYVVAQGYSTTPHVAIYGASAGGIIMGGSVARYPGHFGAAIIHAGMLNPSRLAAQGNGANQYSEFGDATTAAGFSTLLRMDAYQAVVPGRTYPPVLLDVGLNDNRVAPWNSGKFGAALIAAGGSVIYRTDSDSGHFGTSLSQAAAEKADHYTFIEKVMDAD